MLQILFRILVLGFGSLLAMSAEIATGNDQFDVTSMPQGSQVTLPRAAKILAPLSVPVRLSSTDSPQTVSLGSQTKGAGKISPFKIAIHDPRQDRVRYVDIKPGASVLYTFRGLSTIQIIPQISATQRTAINMNQMRLRIESDKPVNISR